MTLTRRRIWMTLLASALPVVCGAGTISLNMNSLPSTQGWTYFSNEALPEASVFTAGGGVLAQDTTWTATDPGVWYSRSDVVTSGSAEVQARMRLISDEFGTPFGGAVEYAVSQYYFIFGLGRPDALSSAQVYYKTGPNEIDYAAIPGIDAAQWHVYRMAIDLTTKQFEFFVDGLSKGTYDAVYNAGVAPIIVLGDLTGSGNAHVEFTSFSFSSTSPADVPEPSGLMLAGAGLAVWAWLKRRRD